ncbi:unnamed protein product [Lepeophtheirus salmonis]|uniref:(salmon louse) hypothetical protein n=1 Tax=Lepeophtheirus salmonis TaxID=72036 RepID=A0A7R8HCE4_LEPSM|nr:unnamed protein product [Lepeophtheirus salmonis]CAF3013543.1 unnamed protein product [Lepeophtheirus salmonis]
MKQKVIRVALKTISHFNNSATTVPETLKVCKHLLQLNLTVAHAKLLFDYQEDPRNYTLRLGFYSVKVLKLLVEQKGLEVFLSSSQKNYFVDPAPAQSTDPHHDALALAKEQLRGHIISLFCYVLSFSNRLVFHVQVCQIYLHHHRISQSCSCVHYLGY